MFGFGKRKSAYEGLLSLSVNIAMSLQTDLGNNHDAVSLAAYQAASLAGSAMGFGVPEHQSEQLKTHMLQGAVDVFGDTMAIKANWMLSYKLAEAAWDTPGTWDAATPFYVQRRETLPWTMQLEQFQQYAAGLQMAVDRMLREQSPKWKPGGLT